MKVIERAKTAQGFNIQVEDWSQDYSFFDISIAVYPIAKNTGKYRWIEGGKIFRVSLSRGWKSREEVYAAFNDLIQGTKELENFSDKFWNGDKDKWYLGMDVEYLDY